MDKLILNADKNADKWIFPKLANPQTVGITSIGQIAQLVEQRTENPSPYSNISNLTPKSVWTSVDISSKCGQYVDKIIL